MIEKYICAAKNVRYIKCALYQNKNSIWQRHLSVNLITKSLFSQKSTNRKIPKSHSTFIIILMMKFNPLVFSTFLLYFMHRKHLFFARLLHSHKLYFGTEKLKNGGSEEQRNGLREVATLKATMADAIFNHGSSKLGHKCHFFWLKKCTFKSMSRLPISA